MKKLATIVALVCSCMLAIAQHSTETRTLFGLTKEEFRGLQPVKNKLTVNSPLPPARVNELINELLFNSFVSIAKNDTGRYIETAEIPLPTGQGLLMYKIFLKPINGGTEVNILPFIKIDAVVLTVTFGSGESNWEPLKGMKGMYESLNGYATRGAIMLALCSKNFDLP